MKQQVRLIAAMTPQGVIGRTFTACTVCGGVGYRVEATDETRDCFACEKQGRVPANDLPWPPYSEDMRYFKAQTVGHPVIMGRATMESIPPKFFPLSDRTNIVLSKTIPCGNESMVVVRTPEEALEAADFFGKTETAYVIGGGEVYKVFLPLATHLDITIVDNIYDGDVLFPLFQGDLREDRIVFPRMSVDRGDVRDRVDVTYAAHPFHCIRRQKGAHQDLTFTTWVRT